MREVIFVRDNPEELSRLVDSLFDETVDPVYQDIFLLSGESRVKINDIVYLLAKMKVNKDFDLDKINNKEIIEDYKKYISKVQELIASLKINDELLCALFVELLIKKGFFSSSLNFHIVNTHVEKLKLYSGTSIILGFGSCRNFVSFYDDVFEGIYNHPLSYGGILSKYDKGEKSNHVINLVNYDDKIHGYDLFNSTPFTFVTPYEMKPDIEPSTNFRYRSYWDLIKNNNKKLKDVERELETYSQSIGSTISPNVHKKKVKMANKLIEDNKWLLGKFYLHTVEDKHKVKKKILRKYGK